MTPDQQARWSIFMKYVGERVDERKKAARRQAEIDKYDPSDGCGAYSLHDYRMTDVLKDRLEKLLDSGLYTESYLDVSCGRGESLELAKRLGHGPVVGTEAVPMLCNAPNKVHAVLPTLPFGDKVFGIVSCLDVMEHLIADDWEASIKELGRVCKGRLLLSISNVEDKTGALLGTELHISRFPYDKIDGWLREWLPDFTVVWRSALSMDHAEVWECVRE